MKKWLMMLVLPMALGLTGVANAAASNNLKIGVVDIQSVIQKSPQTQKLTETLKTQFKPRQEKLMALNKEVQDDQAKLTRDGAVMSNADREKLQSEASDKGRELQRLAQEYQDDLTNARNKDMQNLLAQVQVAVNKVAKSGQFDVILEKQAAPFVSAQMDVTDQVVKLLDQQG